MGNDRKIDFWVKITRGLLPAAIMINIADERQCQNEKWGEQNHDAYTWLAILTEEVGETAQAALHNQFGGRAQGTLRKELIQVAAVAIQWLECIDRNGGEKITASEDDNATNFG